MPRKFLTPIDLGKNELQNARIQNLSGSPASPVAGQLYYDSTANTLYFFNGTGWVGAGGMSAGLLSARPAAGSGNVGTFFYATDNKHIYYSDGSVWTQSDAFGSPSNLASSAADGTAETYSRSDHTHRHTNDDHSSINLSALTTPTTNVSWGGYKITNLAEPTSDQDAATKYYVDNAISGLDWKSSANLLATTNVALTGTTNSLVIDGHSALNQSKTGYRLLLIGQSTASEKGVYTYSDDGTNYTLARSSDADTYQELIGASIFVQEGTAYNKTSWVQSNHYLSSFSGQVWSQFSGAGTYTAGAGLSIDGNIFNVGTVSTSRIVVNSDNIDLAEVSPTNSTGNTSSTIVQGVSVDSYGRVTGVTSGTHTVASTSAVGVASFPTAQFTVATTGAVSISALAGSVISGNITGNAANITGVVAIANGGTGATTAALAATALTLGTTSAAVFRTVTADNSAGSGAALVVKSVTINPTSQLWVNAADNAVATMTGSGDLTAASFAGDGYFVTNLDAANITNGVLGVEYGGTGATTAALAIAALGGAQKRTGTLDFSATTVASVNHGLGNFVTAQSFDGSGFLIDMDVQNTSASGGTTIYTVSATSATATNFTYVIVG
jgi:hypothetical protein